MDSTLNLKKTQTNEEQGYIDRVWLKNQLVKTFQVTIFSPFLLTLPMTTLANFLLPDVNLLQYLINIQLISVY